jgi:tetratricopeptide (TPR) repeat protein
LSDPKSPETQDGALYISMLQAADRNDPATVVKDAEAFWKLWPANPQLQTADDSPCLAALSLGMAGRTAEADAIFHRLGPGHPHCSRPSPVYMARGVSEMNRGNLKSAEADLAQAHTNAPHFADPLKDYGDLLACEGRWNDALAKYDEALKYAPNWLSLHQARDEAARKH